MKSTITRTSGLTSLIIITRSALEATTHIISTIVKITGVVKSIVVEITMDRMIT